MMDAAIVKAMMDNIVIAVRAAAEAAGVDLDPFETMREALIVYSAIIRPHPKAEVKS